MLNDCAITEIECIFVLIDHNVIPSFTALRFLEWLKKKDIERFAYLNWLLVRWVKIRRNKNHLPQRILK